jgi:hypothetical protein
MSFAEHCEISGNAVASVRSIAACIDLFDGIVDEEEVIEMMELTLKRVRERLRQRLSKHIRKINELRIACYRTNEDLKKITGTEI